MVPMLKFCDIHTQNVERNHHQENSMAVSCVNWGEVFHFPAPKFSHMFYEGRGCPLDQTVQSCCSIQGSPGRAISFTNSSCSDVKSTQKFPYRHIENEAEPNVWAVGGSGQLYKINVHTMSTQKIKLQD